MTANGTAALQGLGSSRRSRRTLILLGAAFFMVSGIIVLGLQVAGFGNTDTVTVTVPISTNALRTASTSAAPSSEKPPAGGNKETALTPSPPHATHSGPRLTNGGPGQVYATASWAEARKDFVRPVTVLEPIPTIWDWATVGPCSEALAAAAPSTTWADAEGVIPSLLGRVRLSALLCVGPVKDRAALEATLKELLWKRAPAWRLVSIVSNTGHIVVERRQRVFIFGITGGRDRRAGYVERTWGRRTPIQWYGDEWDPVIRPIIDLHPKYIEDRFNLLTFKISRIWQRVYEDFGPNATALTKPPVELEAGGSGYRWYIRLWDDNYFYEENLHPALSRLDPRSLVMAGKMGWRNMGISAKIIYPFAGGGAGWYLSEAALAALGPSIAAAEKWFVEFRAKKDIFLPHAIHDEDVFLSAWLSILKVRFINIPGVEHVSPGKHNKQRCMDPDHLRALRWDANYTIYFNYPGIEAALRIEDAIYAYFKPIIWHYMSPTRLLALETLLYPERREEFANDKPAKTAADTFKWGKPCYPGAPPGPPPPRGKSLFETPLLDPPVSGG